MQKHKMNTRAKLRFFQRRRMDESKRKAGKVNIQCNTRTVELPETANIGDDKSKLLFMLAIGLVPNAETKCQDCPSVKMERLDPEIEKKAKARTKQVIVEIFESRKAQLLSQQNLEYQCQSPQFQSLMCNPTFRPPCSNSLPSADKTEIEVIDLISSDEESDQNEASEVNAPRPSSMSRGYPAVLGRPATRKRLASIPNGSGSLKKVNLSSHVRKSAFKPLNKQEGGGFVNLKPELTKRKMDWKILEGSENSRVSSERHSQPNFLYSMNLSSGRPSKRYVRGTNGGKSSSRAVLEEADCIPSAIIVTID